MEPFSEREDLAYLQAELTRIDRLIRFEVQRWQASGQNLDDHFRGLYITDEEAGALLDRPFASSWGQTVSAAQDEGDQKRAGEAETSQRILERCEAQGRLPNLAYLARTFGLDAVDQDILLISLAPALDLRYERLYGYLQDDVTRKRPMVNLALQLLTGPGLQRYQIWPHFLDDAPLFRHRLIEKVSEGSRQSLLNQVLHVDETLVSWLLGHYKPGPELEDARLFPPENSAVDRLLAGDVLDSLTSQSLFQTGGELCLSTLVFLGADTARKEAAARQCAYLLNRPLLCVNLGRLGDVGRRYEDYPVELVFRLALRDALLNRAIPFISGLESLLQEDGVLPTPILQLLAGHPGLTILDSQKPVQPREMPDGHSFIWFSFHQPPFVQRKQVWEHYLSAESSLSPEDLDAIAGQFQLTTEQIHDACLTARDAAAQRAEPVTGADLFQAARAYSNHRLISLAKKIDPRYGWEDIILPADQIRLMHEIISTVRSRPVVLEEWGLAKKLASSSGVATLFAGPPGTGKTMAAEIIARELGLDLYKIDLSSVVSKYIGETEKNISRIFEEAETSNAILFFDEADALFGKRSEVRDSHDRYANIEISYLLQRMEAYDGVTILATNLRANLDEAFTRRLQFIVDFPFPQEEDRLRIWKALFPKNVPAEEDLDFQELARRYKLPGANIRNIILSAVYLAAEDGKRVKMQHLLHGTHRELQKMRRLIEEETPPGE